MVMFIPESYGIHKYISPWPEIKQTFLIYLNLYAYNISIYIYIHLSESQQFRSGSILMIETHVRSKDGWYTQIGGYQSIFIVIYPLVMTNSLLLNMAHRNS